MAHAALRPADPVTVRANKLDLVERIADDLAHEIKNPLHSMVINLEVLKRRISRLPEDGSGDLLRYAGVINGELERVSARIELLLQMIRPDRGAEPVSLAAVVDDVLGLVDLERERKELTVEYRPTTRPLRGRIAREPARQLALDLLLMAIDATPRGGRIQVATDSGEDREGLEIRIAASGTGEPVRGVQPEMLAVASALASSLGGSVEVMEPGDHSLSILLSLPAATLPPG